MYIDLETFDKAAHWRIRTRLPSGRLVGRGYELRLPTRPSMTLAGIVLHSTEHQFGQGITDVWKYLRDSPTVSTHYGIGPSGNIVRILDPGPWIAYHAGVSRWGQYLACNLAFVGVELYHREGDAHYNTLQLDAAAWLCRQLLADHPTIQRANIVTHAQVALPPGRKRDPTDPPPGGWAGWIARL